MMSYFDLRFSSSYLIDRYANYSPNIATAQITAWLFQQMEILTKYEIVFLKLKRRHLEFERARSWLNHCGICKLLNTITFNT